MCIRDSFKDEDWEGAFQLCLLSYVRTIRACLPSMRRLGGGRIVNSTSSSVKDCLDNLILSNTMRMGVVAVSYTHLDVYKRQVMRELLA